MLHKNQHYAAKYANAPARPIRLRSEPALSSPKGAGSPAATKPLISLFATEITEDTEKERIHKRQTSAYLRGASKPFHFLSCVLSPCARCPPWFREFAQENKMLTSGSAKETPPCHWRKLVPAQAGSAKCHGSTAPSRAAAAEPASSRVSPAFARRSIPPIDRIIPNSRCDPAKSRSRSAGSWKVSAEPRDRCTARHGHARRGCAGEFCAFRPPARYGDTLHPTGPNAQSHVSRISLDMPRADLYFEGWPSESAPSL